MAKASKVLSNVATGNMTNSVVNGLASQALSNNQMKQQKKLAKEQVKAAEKREKQARQANIDGLSRGAAAENKFGDIVKEAAESTFSNPFGAVKESFDDAMPI